MFPRDSGDYTVLCPFDNTHMILAKSLNSHLVKCRKNHQHLKRVPCKFDRTHMILKPELAHHHSVCPSRVYLDRDLQIRAGGANTLMGNVSGPEIRSSYVESTEENWDAGPNHPGTNALFSRISQEDRCDEEEDEDFTYGYPQSGYDSPAAAASSSYTSSSSSIQTSKEENFRRVPLAPSKAAQLSGPMTAKPKGSSSMVYEYSLQQAVLGRGRGRGKPAVTAQVAGTNINAIRPLAVNQRAPGSYTTTSTPAPHLGRGIARFASPNTIPPAGQGVLPNCATMPVHQGALPPWLPQQQQSQFEDSEDIQAQSGGTSSVETPVTVASEAEGDEQTIPLEEQMKAMLLQEQLKNARELEELKLQQELRHQQLLQQFQQEKMLQAEQLQLQQQRRLQQQLQQHQQQQQLATYAYKASTSGVQATPAVSPPQPGSPSRQGRGRGVQQHTTQLRNPQRPSIAQRLQAEMESKTQEVVSEDLSEEPSQETLETNTGVKGNQKQDFSKMTTEELTRAKRKLEKKLKQILALERKISEGSALSSEEEAKLRKKPSILKERDQIGQYL